MKLHLRLAVLMAAALIVPAHGQDRPQACKYQRYANLALTPDDAGRPIVPVKVNGMTLNMLVDTGAVFSSITEGAAREMKLKPTALAGGGVKGFGGWTENRTVTAQVTEIGFLKVSDRVFMLAPDDLKNSFGIDGILGSDILAAFDLDFDFAGGKIGLFSPDHCLKDSVFWTADPPGIVAFRLDDDRHIRITVTVDGVDLLAIVDTGASDTVMSADFAQSHFKLDAADLKSKGGRAAFKDISMGGVSVRNSTVYLVSDEDSGLMGGSGQPKIIIGMNVLRPLHVFVAFKEHRIYVTPASAH
jgi:predicted aspartyl protease